MRIRKNKGFTFVELILAVTIFSIIAVSIYSTFMAGLRVWLRCNPMIELNQNTRFFFDTISSDLKNIIKYESTQAGGQGAAQGAAGQGGVNFDVDSGRITFWTLVNVAGPGIPLHREIAKVQYYFDAGGKAITRAAATMKEGFDISAAQSSAMISNLEEGSFLVEYCYEPDVEGGEYVWNAAWGDKSTIPRGARIKVGDFRKTIFIPTGELGKAATGAGGGGAG